MFSYYGSKTNLVPLYPRPKHDKIIEPFAGSAKYALEYFDRNVLLVDKYQVIIDIWKWLQKCSPNDILSLPRTISHGTRFDSIPFSCTEERNFFSFVSGSGDQSPRNQPTKRKTIDRPNHLNYNLKKVASNLFKIKHWEIQLGSYDDIPNESATWFIDPPYQFGGNVYIESNRNINFEKLSEWCRSREGQIIVCENTKADWMEFKPMVKQKGSNATTIEAIWCNEQTAFDFQQQILF